MVEVYFLSIKSRLQQCLICFLPTFLLLSSGMVTFPVHFRMLFFCQFQKVSKIPLNYRGIALASCVSKVLEWCIILTWSQYFVTDDLQFGFIPGYSTTLCTGIINCYIKWSSNIYACLIDTSKAFDTVDHYVLFEKLITKSIPIPIARFLTIVSWSASVGMVLILLSSLSVTVCIREVCLAQSCLQSMSTVFCVLCVNLAMVVTGTVYLQVHYATLMTSQFWLHQLMVWEKWWKFVRNLLAHTLFQPYQSTVWFNCELPLCSASFIWIIATCTECATVLWANNKRHGWPNNTRYWYYFGAIS